MYTIVVYLYSVYIMLFMHLHTISILGNEIFSIKHYRNRSYYYMHMYVYCLHNKGKID